MGASLGWGVRSSPVARAWLVVLADMPWIEPQTIARVGRALDGGARIAAPSWRTARGHPVGFAASFYAALSALSGDEGAKAILARHPVELVPVDDQGVVRDVDRPEDLV
jgi:molybdenum cofactor cytidylyltransferase